MESTGMKLILELFLMIRHLKVALGISGKSVDVNVPPR